MTTFSTPKLCNTPASAIAYTVRAMPECANHKPHALHTCWCVHGIYEPRDLSRMTQEEYDAAGPSPCGSTLKFMCKACSKVSTKRQAREHFKGCKKCGKGNWQDMKSWVLIKDANKISNKKKTNPHLTFEIAYNSFEEALPATQHTTAPPPPLQDTTHDNAPLSDPPPPVQDTPADRTVPSPHTPNDTPSPHTPNDIPSPHTPNGPPPTPFPPHCSRCGASCLYCTPTPEFLQYLNTYAAATPPPQSTPPQPPQHPGASSPSAHQGDPQDWQAEVSAKLDSIHKSVIKVDCEVAMPESITIRQWVYEAPT